MHSNDGGHFRRGVTCNKKRARFFFALVQGGSLGAGRSTQGTQALRPAPAGCHPAPVSVVCRQIRSSQLRKKTCQAAKIWPGNQAKKVKRRLKEKKRSILSTRWAPLKKRTRVFWWAMHRVPLAHLIQKLVVRAPSFCRVGGKGQKEGWWARRMPLALAFSLDPVCCVLPECVCAGSARVGPANGRAGWSGTCMIFLCVGLGQWGELAHPCDAPPPPRPVLFLSPRHLPGTRPKAAKR